MSTIGRVNNAFASAHDRTRVHCVRIYPGESRRLLVSFNSVIPKGERIIKATFRQVSACSVAMADPQLERAGRAASVQLTAAYRGCQPIKVTVQTDAGNAYVLMAVAEVKGGPWFGDEETAAGPTELTVTDTP